MQSAGARRAADAVERMPLAGFHDELRRVAQVFRPRVPAADPMGEALKRIEQNPAYTQSRLLTRILTALTSQQGEFRRAEASSLDSDTLFMALALIDAYAAGKPAHDEWIRAADSATAAQSGAEG